MNCISQISEAESSATVSILINYIIEVMILFLTTTSLYSDQFCLLLIQNEGYYLLQLLRRIWKYKNMISFCNKDVQVETKMSFRLTVFQKLPHNVDRREVTSSYFWMSRRAILSTKFVMFKLVIWHSALIYKLTHWGGNSIFENLTF